MMAVMFKQLAFTIIFSQIASLLTTFLLVPMLTSKIKKGKAENKILKIIFKPFNRFLDLCYKYYESFLRAILKKRKTTLVIVAVLFLVSIIGLLSIGMELMPSSDSGAISVNVELPSGAEISDTDVITGKIEKIIMENPDVMTVFSQVGSGDSTSMITGASSSNKSVIYVTLNDIEKRKKSTEDVASNIRNSINDISGAIIEVNVQDMAMSGMSSDEITVEFSGNNDEILEGYIYEAEKILADIPGIVETSTSTSDTNYELIIKPNRTKSMMYGMTPVQTATLVDNIISGTTASRYTEGGSEYNIVVKYPDEYADTYEKLKNLRIKTTTGSWVSISDIADVTVEEGFTTLTRVNQRRVMSLSGKIYGSDLGSVTKKFDDALKEHTIPDGISKYNAGTYEVMIDAMKQIFIAIMLGILLMYMVMAGQFESYTQPLIILITLPLAMIGVTLSLIVTGSKLSAVSCIGILMLVGIVVNNAIVLIEFINQQRREDPSLSCSQAVINAGIVRMRPILMTSLTSILGFLPMAMASIGGTSMMSPLAIVLLGGLLVGTLLTLFIIPVVYTIFDDFKRKSAVKDIRYKKEVYP